MSARKTVRVSDTCEVLQQAILALGVSKPEGYQFQQSALCWALERVLHDSDNYRGFQFVDRDSSDPGDPGYYNRKYYLPKD